MKVRRHWLYHYPLPIITLAFLGYLWAENGFPRPERPLFLILTPLFLFLWVLFPKPATKPGWSLPQVNRKFHWLGSARRLLYLLGGGALPAALIALTFSLSAFSLQTAGLRRDAAMVLLYDYSASMLAPETDGRTRSEQAREIANELIMGSEAAQLGLVGFAQKAALLSPLTTDCQILSQILQRPLPDLGQSTAIGDALITALAHLAQNKAQLRLVVVISDGLNNSGSIALDEAISAAKELNIPLHTILIGNTEDNGTIPAADGTALEKLASATGGRYWRPENIADLVKLLKSAPILPTATTTRAIDFSSGPALLLLLWALIRQFWPGRPRHG